MPSGIIRLLDKQRGYGFVSSSSGRDIFFHYSQLQGVDFQALRKGQLVSYRVGLGEKGFVARDVKLCPSFRGAK